MTQQSDDEFIVISKGRRISKSELKAASIEEQIEIMRIWFDDNFSEPARAEGENIFVAGGPYEPGWKLSAKFGKLVSDEALQALTQELENIYPEWDGKGEDEDEGKCEGDPGL